MGDMKDALRRAGLASNKDLRQAAHQERVRKKQLGEEGLAAERHRKAEEYQAEQKRGKQEDREREEALRAQRENAERRTKVERLLSDGDLTTREAGPRRFYFETPGGRIFFLDVSPALVRRFSQGDAAIVDTRGILRADFAAVSGKVAHEVALLDSARILLWNTRR
jgi:uncharacterized protein YaiL (DUF2058 family)